MAWIESAYVEYQELLPKYDDFLESTLNELSKVYGNFIQEGKFFKLEIDPYACIVPDDGVSGKPYEIIGDWCNELTGEMGFEYVPITFEKYLREIVEQICNFDIDDFELLENYPKLEDDSLTMVTELVEVIKEISINELENRI